VFDLGPHASFIIAAYAVTFLAIGVLAFVTVEDDRTQRRRLAELERKGIRRRSAAKPKPEAPTAKATVKRKPRTARARKNT